AALPGRAGPAPPKGGSAHRARPRPGSGPFGAGTGLSRVPCPAKRVAAGPVRTGPPTAAAAPRSPRGSRPVQPACAGGRPRGRPPPRPPADAATGARGGGEPRGGLRRWAGGGAGRTGRGARSAAAGDGGDAAVSAARAGGGAGRPLVLAVGGAGPRGTSLVERIAANAAEAAP